jgi:hypothetical protein
MKIKNNLIGFFYNRFDFVIRFLYCKMPFISKLLFWKLYSSDFKKLDNNFKDMKNLIYSSNYSFKNKVCLEIGPGNSYINAYNLLMNGAKKVILVDKFPRYIKTKKQKQFFDKELNYIKKKYSKKDLLFIKNKKIDNKYIEFIPKDLIEANLKEKVDFVYSISVFEHIKEVEKNTRKLSEIIKNNGLMYHYIDMRDHYNFNNPFLFYKYSDKIWNKYLTKEGVSYTNRLRYDDYVHLFKKYEFELLKEEKERFNFERKKIDKKFKSKENINIGILRLLLKKK